MPVPSHGTPPNVTRHGKHATQSAYTAQDATSQGRQDTRQDTTRPTHPRLKRPDEVVAAPVVPGLRAKVDEQTPSLAPSQEDLQGGLAQPVAPLAHPFHLRRAETSIR